MKKRSYFVLLTVIVLNLTLCSCGKKQKDILEISELMAAYTTEQVVAEADLILKGRVASVDEGVMVNPNNDKTLKDDTGRGVANEQIHTYVFKIDTVYKGDYTADTVEIKTSNGYALSPDLILYGEDDTTVLATDLERFDLEVGSECILALEYIDLHMKIRSGYYVVGNEQGVFSVNQADLFVK